LSDTNNRPGRNRRPAPQPNGARRPTGSTGPTGTPRSGRRDTARRRYDQPSTLQRLRTPLLALGVVAVIVGVSLFVFVSAAAPTYACTSIDTVKPAASGELGQVQPDMGNQHVQPGDKVTYQVCPPASGKHINKSGFGPLQPKVYGPEDQSVPNGWVHNLEHGGLVLLYSCTKGTCDDALTQQLQAFIQGFPNSPVCNLQPGLVGPVIARFEDMPTRFAALVWDRVLYLDTLDTQEVYGFFTRYAERVADDGTWIAPPEPQCQAPSPGTSAAPGTSSAPSPGTSSAPAASPGASPVGPGTEPSPSAG
jgi:hypothetical protein